MHPSQSYSISELILLIVNTVIIFHFFYINYMGIKYASSTLVFQYGHKSEMVSNNFEINLVFLNITFSS